MVFAIIGCVFAAIQLIVAADGADEIDRLYGKYNDGCTAFLSDTVCNDVSRFRFSRMN